jgi:hypothetical protein
VTGREPVDRDPAQRITERHPPAQCIRFARTSMTTRTVSLETSLYRRDIAVRIRGGRGQIIKFSLRTANGPAQSPLQQPPQLIEGVTLRTTVRLQTQRTELMHNTIRINRHAHDNTPFRNEPSVQSGSDSAKQARKVHRAASRQQAEVTAISVCVDELAADGSDRPFPSGRVLLLAASGCR